MILQLVFKKHLNHLKTQSWEYLVQAKLLVQLVKVVKLQVH